MQQTMHLRRTTCEGMSDVEKSITVAHQALTEATEAADVALDPATSAAEMADLLATDMADEAEDLACSYFSSRVNLEDVRSWTLSAEYEMHCAAYLENLRKFVLGELNATREGLSDGGENLVDFVGSLDVVDCEGQLQLFRT